jgi:hypothetical protein
VQVALAQLNHPEFVQQVVAQIQDKHLQKPLIYLRLRDEVPFISGNCLRKSFDNLSTTFVPQLSVL